MSHVEELLCAVEPALSRPGAAGFIARCDLIDRLELCAGAPVDDALHALEEANTRTVEDLRRAIRSGACVGGALLDELAHYVTQPAPTADNAPYDHLDILVCGLLRTDALAPTDSTKMLPGMVAYQPTPARVVLELARFVSSQDVLVDVGAGLGLVPLLVSLLTQARTIGIEIDSTYSHHAERIAFELNATRTASVCQDARTADFSTGTIFYMYTPFDGAMSREVQRRLSVEAQRRDIRICTYGPRIADAVRTAMPALDEDVAGGLRIFKTTR